ncbi:MAG: hypothetical protein AB8G99_17280, partial [Planctomycetaceae bacterium]
NEPIHARRVGPIGKTWRWCKRRPLIATLLLGLSTSITAGVVGVTYQWQRAEVALQNSEADLRDALESVDKVLSHLGSDTLEDVPQAKQLRADVLADALEFFQRFRKRNPDDPRVALQVASAHSQGARILSALGRGDEAGKAYEAAVRDYERLEDTAPDHEDWMAAASTAHSRYGFFLVNRSKREQAVEQLQKCASLRKQLLAEDPSSSYRKARVASARADLGRMLKDQTKGEAEFDAAIKQLSKLTAKSDKIGYQRDLARILNNYSIYLTKAGKQGRAEDCRAQASVLYEAVIAADPNDESALAAYANCCRKQVEALRGESNLVAFEKYQQKAIDAYQRLTEDYPATPRHRDRFSSVLVEAAKYYRVQKRDDDAFATQERVVQQREILVSLFPGNTRYQRRLSGSLASLATKLSQVNRKTDAERRLRQRLTIRRKLAADKSPNDTVYAALAMKDLATLIKTSNSKKKKQEAVELQKEADELVAELSVEQVLWQDTSTTSKLTLLSSLTAVAKKENDLKGIEQAYRGKVEVLTQRLKTDSTNPKKQSDLARQWYVLGRFLRLNDREDEALDPYREAIRLDEQLLEADPQSARYLSQMVGHCSEFGQLLSKTDRVDEAIEVLDRSLEIARNLAEKHENVGFRNARFAFAYIQLADALTKRQGDEEQILIAYESAVELATAPVEKADFANVKPMAINSLAWFLLHCPDESLQDPERALELANQLIAIQQVTGRHYSTLAVAQFRNADYASAIASLQKSTELSPKLIALNTLITSMAQANLGDMETAAENYAEAVRLNAENSVEPELFEQYRQLADELLTRTGTAETDSEGP